MTGKSILGNHRGSASSETFHAFNPATDKELDPPFHAASEEEVDTACELAGKAFGSFRNTSPKQRSDLLERIARGLESRQERIVTRYVQESGLPESRARGEFARTTGQLRMFSNLLKSPNWNQPMTELADPDRQPMPKPDIRFRYTALGPVAVFGPSNFPLAFSCAGGDVASALAAGCPVVVKAHSSHPGISEMTGEVVLESVQDCGLEEGVFSLLFGSGNLIGQALARHPAIKAIGFTGSASAGRSLFDLGARRQDPIPVFAEMGSLNPVILLPDALTENWEYIAEGLCASVTLGVGQFCTQPGVVFLPEGRMETELFVEAMTRRLANVDPQPMLNPGICQSYWSGLRQIEAARGVTAKVAPRDVREKGSCYAVPALFQTSMNTFIDEPTLHEENFGPSTLFVTYSDLAALKRGLETLNGQLTITFHVSERDLREYPNLLSTAEAKAGRIVMNGFPTGVEVCHSMVHGGPFPAATDARFTSVGAKAIYRFLRPVCYQNFVNSALPKELQ